MRRVFGLATEAAALTECHRNGTEIGNHRRELVLAASFAAPLLALDFAQLDYKGQLDNRGMTAGRQRLVVLLNHMTNAA
ncbi:hypothetical protein [Mesorhizobium sp.]|uniref:hypothetical protein n=1 Tax=Mesorhizobium sp. TaxID=1871066 RepID=UPI00257ABC9C|nr:hypothetical protein [Mesorhizobium sp.]